MAGWIVGFDDRFKDEFKAFGPAVQFQIGLLIRQLELQGPSLKRPQADTLKGSKHKNMKELRFKAGNGAWRLAFAFDPKRQAIFLVAADKSGISQNLFYKTLIAHADERFDEHLSNLNRG